MKTERMYDQYDRPYEQIVIDWRDKQLRIRPATVKYIESEIRYYHESIKQLDQIKQDILFSSSAPDTNGGGRPSLPGDPTGKIGTLLVTHKQITNIQSVIQAIKETFESLPEQRKQLVRMRYWNKHRWKWEGIALELGVSEKTVRNWRKDIIQQIASKLGMM